MISMTHRSLWHFYKVASKTFGRTLPRDARIEFHADGSGLVVKLAQDDRVLRYQLYEPQPDTVSVGLDYKRLRPLACNEHDSFVIRRSAEDSHGSVSTSSTRLTNVPLHVVSPDSQTPAIASVIADKQRLTLLSNCAAMVDKQSYRDGYRCIQLDGHRQAAAATDGRKAFVAKRCEWPWSDERLVRSTGWFASPVVALAASRLQVDDIGNAARFTMGPWSLELPFETHRFPDVHRVFPARWQADTIVRLTDDCRKRILDAIKKPRMPKDGHAVTLQAGRTCIIRTGTADGDVVHETVLPHATRAGVPYVAALPRHALVDFARLGFDELLATERAETFWSYDTTKQFVFKPLHEKFAMHAGNGSAADDVAA